MAPAPAGDGCLQGKVFGLTGELTRKPLEAAIKSHGATVSAIIHKRVSFVLCTADAVKHRTQKVRKALKHGIPLVSQDFIAACALASRVVDQSPFLQAPQPSTQASPSSGAKQPKPDPFETLGDAASLRPGGGGVTNPAGDHVCAGNFFAEEVPKEISKKRRRRCLEESEPTRRPGGGEGGAGEEGSGGGSGLRSGGGGSGGGAGDTKERKKKKKKERKEKKKRENKEIEGQKANKEKKGNKENREKKTKEKQGKKKKRQNVAEPQSDNE